MLGGPVGSSVGTSLGAAISKWLGSGDYTVDTNSIVRSAKASTSIPLMHTSNQTVVVRHKEYLGTVKSSTEFKIQHSYPINPGLKGSFPWLSNIAQGFSEYRIKGLVYHYVPTSGHSVASTNTALGSVMMTTNYRCTDSEPSSKVELLNEYWACESVPSETFAHPIECDPKENPFNIQYTRSADVPADDSRLMYDLGNTYVATQGQQIDGATLGDLWVTYEVELKKPVLISNTTPDDHTRLYFSSSPAVISGLWFNQTIPPAKIGNLNVYVNSDGAITIPKGQSGNYYFTVYLRSENGLTSPADYYQSPTYFNCSPVTWRQGDSDPVATTIGVGGANFKQVFFNMHVRKPDTQLEARIVMPVIVLAGSGVWNSSTLHCWRLEI